MSPADPSPVLPERYRFVRRLGAGGMGAVLLVHDEVRAERVALKRVLSESADARIRFKREFRMVADLLHPHLVRLYELGDDATGPYFTMEAVQGVTLGEHCRGVGADPDAPTELSPEPGGSEALTVPLATALRVSPETASAEERLPAPPVSAEALDAVVATTPQLLEALSFLHAHAIVHRDLKPDNVMVCSDGVVKVLDFGVLATATEEATTRTQASIIGTIGYIAPELLRGAVPLPAADLYSLGATLFELLTGRPVFPGASTLERAVRHMRDPAPPLRTLVSGVPAPLAELVDGLLQGRPEDRPSLERCAELVVAAGGRAAELARPRASGALIGRDRELSSALAACRAALGRGGVVVLAGSSGTGKTVVAEAIAKSLGEEGALVLRGRGRADDRLAFNAVDGAVDQLALDIAAEESVDDRTRELAALAAAAFPVLLTHARGGAARSRLEAFEAVARLVAHRAGTGGAVLLVDDLQWADTDSLRLLHELRAAGVVVLATLRDDGAAPAVDEWVSATDAHVVHLRPLGRAALEVIIRRAAGTEVPDEVLERALALCDGRPYFAELAGLAVSRGERGHPLDALVVDALAEGGECVAALLAADDWVRVGVLAAHLGTTPGDADDAVAALATRGVVRRAGATGPDQRVDIFHDALRAALGAAIDPLALAAAHGRFADLALGGQLPGESRARTARHLLAAGRPTEAAQEARGAAQEAEEHLAFSLAADMLGLALEHDPTAPPELLRRRAELLERVARYREAAECWDAVAAASVALDRTEATIRSASCLLGANRMTEGTARLDDALVASGDRHLGRRGLAEIWAAVRFVRGPSAPRVSGPDPEASRRAEAELRLGTLLGYFDPLQGVRVLLRARDTFARVGNHEQVARCEMLFAILADFGHPGLRPSPLSERYAASAERRIAEHGCDGPLFEAYRRYLEGTRCLREARWDEADAHLRTTVASIESIGERGSFEHTYGLTSVGLVAYLREDFAALEQTVRRFREMQRDGGDLTLESHAQLMTIVISLARGDWEAAEREVAEGLATLPSIPSIQRPVLLCASALLPLHRGDPTAALDRVLEAEPYARHFRLHRSSVPNHAAVTALVEVRALQASDRRASRRRIHRRLQTLDRAGLAGAGVASRVRGYLASHRGRPDEAVSWLERSEAEARDAGRPVSEAIARYQRGLRLGGDEGLALRTGARRLLLGLGLTPVLLEDGMPSE